ncbi:TonB-dependent receptor plug domain-containing protein [Leptobacterium flavescens]|uniref:TonB-dependent receptor plug domain-containing protein n=1 Tax=Leptobacterium flavescens TaxID=472055 RepID=A0A6P0UTG4_9FLAO|nr:TonB-dependent receptor [Leptobacterium flavescens]NER14143.1 TonB-dependent receptor plug domain-containing protein [Leptobacterium flavescens]
MKRIVFIVLGITAFLNSQAQTVVSGKVTDSRNNPIMGANVFLEGTYDGGSTNEKGYFSFESSEKGQQELVISYLSFETFRLKGEIGTLKDLHVKLREEVNTLSGVTLTAGTFEAGDNAKVSVLKPLDVVTTASALGDFVGALQTLPGTSTVAEDGRLFVRGGEAEETQIFIDGIRVFTPYNPTTNNVPTRGRYSPFLFDGITFSTGGYSAEYGQALSSVLLLNTISEPDQEKTDIAVMTVGGGVGNTQKWEKNSLSINTSYINLAPYLELFPDRNDWEKPFEIVSGEAVYRHQFENGLLKLYTAFDNTNLNVFQEDINFDDLIQFRLRNNNLYFNGSYTGALKNNWVIQTGGSFTYGNTKVRIIDSDVEDNEKSIHAKLKLKKGISSRFKLNMGAEYFSTDFEEQFEGNDVDFESGFNNNLSAVFAESDIFFSKKLATKIGLRAEYSELLKESYFSPRLSLAYKTSEHGQLSLAYGDFYQNPREDVLKFNTDLTAEKTTHYILNYQYSHDGRIFRAEAFYKDYDQLIKYDTEFAQFDSNFNNDGFGYAAGLDIFWRDNRSFKSLDYWVSYSYLDTEREYRNFPERATPSIASTHNFSLVGKYWIEKWKSQVGFAYTFASGRSFTDPNTNDFLGEKTKPFNSLSINWAYLISPQKILYFSVSNVLGFRNINGYQYANTPNTEGIFDRRALRPAADQFFFVGFFWTISEDKKSNQLDNL